MKIKKKGVSILLRLDMLVSPIVNLNNFNTVYAADNKSITIPASNILSKESLKDIMIKVANGQSLWMITNL